jgi:hypothetical protein
MNDIGVIAILFLGFRDQLKIYHWKTLSYSRHKASDKLIGNLTEMIDTFIETMQGSRGERIQLGDIPLMIKEYDDKSIIDLLDEFKEWLSGEKGLVSYLKKTDTDLLNLRDEILAKINQTLYLFSLS